MELCCYLFCVSVPILVFLFPTLSWCSNILMIPMCVLNAATKQTHTTKCTARTVSAVILPSKEGGEGGLYMAWWKWNDDTSWHSHFTNVVSVQCSTHSTSPPRNLAEMTCWPRHATTTLFIAPAAAFAIFNHLSMVCATPNLESNSRSQLNNNEKKKKYFKRSSRTWTM